MAFSIKFAAASGLLGIIVMFALWSTGMPPQHLWLLALWPSQVVGMGMDGVQILPEIVVQFTIYFIAGFAVGMIIKAVRSNA